MTERGLAILLAFGSGFVVLAVELVGARILGPTFGISVVPWTAVISVVLAGLALGNWVGGRLADGVGAGGRPLLHWIFLAGAGAVVFPLLGESLTSPLFRSLGTVGGVLISSLLLFGPAAVLLGCVVPYLIRRVTRSLEEVGTRTGDMGGAASAGSIAGTLTTGFVLIPTLPVDGILIMSAGALVVLAGVARWLEGRLRARSRSERGTAPTLG